MQLLKNFKPYVVYQFSAEAYRQWIKEAYADDPETLKMMDDPKYMKKHDAEVVLPLKRQAGRFYSEAGCSVPYPDRVLPEWCEVLVMNAADFGNVKGR